MLGYSSDCGAKGGCTWSGLGEVVRLKLLTEFM